VQNPAVGSRIVRSAVCNAFLNSLTAGTAIAPVPLAMTNAYKVGQHLCQRDGLKL